jgi:putative acetyltransferase
MLIRTEAPADILAIDRLLKETFPNSNEAELVMSLRENSQLTLSLVACDDEGELVGHVMFSPVTVAGEFLSWQGLAPLSVKEAYRGQGIDVTLVKEGLDSLLEFGYPACIVLGDIPFYRQFGFKPTEQFHCGLNDAPLQLIELAEGETKGQSGLIEYCAEFSILN